VVYLIALVSVEIYRLPPCSDNRHTSPARHCWSRARNVCPTRHDAAVLPADSGDALSTAGDISSVAAALFAALAVAGALRELWRRTLGRRRDLRRRLERLGCGAQLSFFEALLGEPATIRRPLLLDESDEPRRAQLRRAQDAVPPERFAVVDPSIDVCLWVYPECCVQAFVDATSIVRGFSVTLRDRRFKPRFRFGPLEHRGRFRRLRSVSLFDVRLGHTRLANAVQEDYVPTVRAWFAARAWQYADLYYFGNPGYYLTFVAASSHAGNPRHCGAITEVCDEIDYSGRPAENPWPSTDPAEWSTLAATHRFRQLTTVTTYAVIDDHALAARIPNFGPHGDEVRTLLQAR
jgi:hypothetical protein